MLFFGLYFELGNSRGNRIGGSFHDGILHEGGLDFIITFSPGDFRALLDGASILAP